MPDPIATINISYREDDLSAIDAALAKVTASRVRCLEIAEAARLAAIEAARPKPSVNVEGKRTPVKLIEPYSFTGKTATIENLDIDANGVSRVFDIPDNFELVVKNCTIKNANSIIEKDVQKCTIRLENVHCGVTKRYAVYVGSRGINDRDSNQVIIRDSSFMSSQTETPLRFMPGVAVAMFNTTAEDSIDIGSNKVNQGARFHCYSVYAEDCRFSRWTIIGPETDSKNNPTDCTVRAEFVRCQFDGGARITKGIKLMRFVDCKFDASKGLVGWALSRFTNGVTKDVKMDFRASGCEFKGKVETTIGKFVECVFV